MPSKTYLGVDNKARKVKKLYIGDASNKARKVKKIYIGDANNKARLIFSGSKRYIFVGGVSGEFTVSNENNYNTVTELAPSESSTAYETSLVAKLNGEVIMARGYDPEIGYCKYDPATNSLTALPMNSTGTSLAANEVDDMAYGNGYYLGLFYDDVDEQYRLAYTTSLTASWTPFRNSSKNFLCLQYHNGSFYVFSYYDYKISRYSKLPTTTAVSSAAISSGDYTFRGFTIFNGRIIVSAPAKSSETGTIHYCDESSNMSTWNRITVPGISPVCLTNAGDKLIAIDVNTKKLCYSTDGLYWTLVNTITGLRAVYYDDGVYYATQGSAVYQSTDLATWTQISTGHATPPFISLRKHFICTELEE